MEETKRILILTLGGTIAMEEDENGKAKSSLPGDRLVAQIEKYGNIGAELQVREVFNIPSGHLTIEMMYALAAKIQIWAKNNEADGFVVIQGTDTQEETAYVLELSLDIRQPVIITGAMRNVSEPSYDGIINIRNACRAAACPDSEGRSVMLYCNDMLHAARDVTKTSSCNVATFQSPFYGPLGIVEKHRVIYYRKMERREHYPIPQLPAEVAVIKVVAGMKDYLLQACISQKVSGIVIEGFGRGHVTPDLVPAIKKAIDEGIVVILCSRCIGGLVLDTYGHETSASRLKKLGVIFGGDLSGQKARIKLISVLGKTRNHEEIRDCFEKGLYTD